MFLLREKRGEEKRQYIRFCDQLGKRRTVGFSNFRRDNMNRVIDLIARAVSL